MRHPMAVAGGLVLSLSLLSGPTPLAGQPPTPEQERLIARIRELRRQIDELLAQLPPHLRDAVVAQRADGPPPRAPRPADADPVPRSPATDPPARPEPRTAAAPESRLAGPRWRRRGCNTLAAFDTDGDGAVTALDRYFRHLYLWVDRDGDRRPQEREVTSTYREKVREIAVELDTFVGGKRGFLGEIRLGEHIELDVGGNGFGGPDDAVLIVDASALKRGEGPELLSPDGRPLEGYQPFSQGLRMRLVSGEIRRLDCP